MKKLLLIKYGEISLKGQNIHYFIDTLVRNIKRALYDYPETKVYKIQGRLLVKNIEQYNETEIISKLQKVFGIVYITPALVVPAKMEAIYGAALTIMQAHEGCSFKVEARRSDKSFPLKSPEIAREVGAHILKNTQDITVNVHNPEVLLQVEVREEAYVYGKDIPAESGLPVGVSGKGGLLLSGGIDSPVAGYLMSKRGMKVTGIHFHSYPFTSLNAKQKVEDLARKLVDYNQGFHLLNISLTEIQEEIISKCDTRYLTVILRRFMIRCANLAAKEYHLDALITGESLGQVASQTIESITCTNEIARVPILRPLIGTDKNDIIKIARHIDTYETSILPYEDCCTIFVPKHPQTRPVLSAVEAEEDKLACEVLVQRAMESIESIKLS